MNRIGPQIKKIREQQELTQDQLAAKCNLVRLDLSRSTLAKIEAQVRRVTDIEVELIARSLGVEISDLFTS